MTQNLTGEPMARVGNSIIKGIEVSEIIAKLNRAYADEWLAYYQYLVTIQHPHHPRQKRSTFKSIPELL
jgi:ferritin-like protein